MRTLIARSYFRFVAAALAMTFSLGLAIPQLAAHEVSPSVADLSHEDGTITVDIELTLEGILAGIDLSSVTDTNDADGSETYDSLRGLSGPELEAQFEAFWPEMAEKLQLLSDSEPLSPELASIAVPDVGNIELPRLSQLTFTAQLPEGATTVEFGWDRAFGALVLRQVGVEEPFEAFLEGGATTGPIPIAGGGQLGGWETFVRYIGVGFDHIIPKGLDHILFVLGLFFLSPTFRPLLWQVTAFTLAHTITLALGVTGLVSVPGEIVEPIIAASIVLIAVENIFTSGLSRWRPAVVFVFGLLHGLGFASVLQEFGLPTDRLVPALIGFNVGVELGQLAVIAIAFLAVGIWFRSKPWYRSAIAIPGSIAIALIGAFWFFERIGVI